MRKTRKEIIDETFAYYNEDPSRRGLLTDHMNSVGSVPSCAYITPTGNMCAVGRCLLENRLPDIKRFNADPVYDLVDVFGGDVFKEEYRGHSVDFWNALQELHDLHAHWGPQGATPKGVLCAADLHARWDETETN